MASEYISGKKIASIFLGEDASVDWEALAQEGRVPAPQRYRSGIVTQLGYAPEQLPVLGAQIGFFKPFRRPLTVTVFTTKGGVLKSTLAMNIARTAALHGLKTCVVGLDMQGDVTSALGYDPVEEDEGLDSALARVERTRGLSDYFQGKAQLSDLIVPTDLPT